MNKLSPTEKKLAVANVLLIGGAAVFFVVWISVIEPAIQTFIEVAIGKKIYELPDIMRWVYMSVFGLLPPFAIGGAAYAYAYYKLYLPIRAKLAADQLQKLAEARRAMMSAVDLMESFEQELRAKSSKVEKLREEVLSLKLINSENVAELERKLRAMDSLTRNRIWLERTIAFVIGILASLAASVLWQVIRDH